MSTFYEREIPITKKSIIHTPLYYNSYPNKTSYVGESRTHVPACPQFSRYCNTPAYQSRHNVDKVDSEHRVVEFARHTVNTNRVIAFHSTPIWRDYFHASKKLDKLIVIYFTASWCSPCRYMAPTLDEFASRFTDVEFDKIDVDELFTVSQEFGVHTMPTFLFVKRGEEIDRVIGARREDLQRKIEMHRA